MWHTRQFPLNHIWKNDKNNSSLSPRRCEICTPNFQDTVDITWGWWCHKNVKICAWVLVVIMDMALVIENIQCCTFAAVKYRDGNTKWIFANAQKSHHFMNIHSERNYISVCVIEVQNLQFVWYHQFHVRVRLKVQSTYVNSTLFHFLLIFIWFNLIVQI